MRNNKTEFGFWTVNGSPDFAWMPSGRVPVTRCSRPVPIRLQVGTREWGAQHIALRHGSWLAQHGVSAAEMVHLKLSQPGSIYATEEASKLKVNHPFVANGVACNAVFRAASAVFNSRDRLLQGQREARWKVSWDIPRVGKDGEARESLCPTI